MSSSPDLFFYEAFEEEREALQRYCPPHLHAEFSPLTIQENPHGAPPAAIISVRTQSVLPLVWAPELRAILTRSAGYDHLSAYRRQANAPALQYGYLPLYCARAVAEQAMMLTLTLLRKLPRQIRQYRTFERDHLTGGECRGRRLLVVGVGNIGHEIVCLARAMGMKVTGVDLDPRHADVDYRSIEEALPEADVIVAAMNLTADNLNYFSYDRMKAVRRGALFVNVARGELAFAGDLLRLLEDGILGGAALDVFNQEPLLSVQLRSGRFDLSNPELAAMARLQLMENVVLTPHNAFNTSEAVERKSSQSMEQIAHLLDRGAFLWPVPPSGPAN